MLDTPSGGILTAYVFESKPGLNDGNTSSRWTQVVAPILRNNNLALPTMDESADQGATASVSEQLKGTVYETPPVA